MRQDREGSGADTVSAAFNQSIKSIFHSSRGRGSKNLARWVAMVLSQNMSDQALSALAKAFHVEHISGLNQAKKKLEKEFEKDQNLRKKVTLLYQKLMPCPPSL